MVTEQREPEAPAVPKMYTPAEIAAIFAVDVRTVRRWIEAGEIVAIKLPGGHWRIEESEVERLRVEGRAAARGS